MHSLKLKSPLIKLTKSERLYELDIPIIGLTGGIACGKSTVANLFRDLSFLVIDADKLIHQIYQDQKTIEFIKDSAPQCIKNNVVDFTSLREAFFNDSQLKESIVSFLYKKLPEYFKKALTCHSNPEVIIYDVPMLFENQLELELDLTITVYTPQEIQIKRVMKRDNIPQELAQKIIQQQMDIEQKRNKADYVLENTSDLEELSKRFQQLTSKLFI